MSKCIFVTVMMAVIIMASSVHADSAGTAKRDNLWPGDPDSQLAQAARLFTGKVDDLLNNEPLVRQLAMDRIIEQRSQLITGLIAIAGRKDNDQSIGGPLDRAIVLLGHLRAAEAVDMLSNRLAYLPPGPPVVFNGGPTEGYYPCAKALAEIGVPAIPGMVVKIRDTKDEAERSLAIWVIMEIEGKDQAAHRFDDLAKNTTTSEYRKRYESAKEYISSYKPGTESPYKGQQKSKPIK